MKLYFDSGFLKSVKKLALRLGEKNRSRSACTCSRSAESSDDICVAKMCVKSVAASERPVYVCVYVCSVAQCLAIAAASAC